MIITNKMNVILNSLSEEERNRIMWKWSAIDWLHYFRPNGTMSDEEFERRHRVEKDLSNQKEFGDSQEKETNSNTQQYDIFISYSQKDHRIVHEFAAFLKSMGYRVWHDSAGLYGGAKFAAEIADALEASKLVIYFSSENSNKSVWTKGEIFMAQHFDKPIIPVRLDDSEYEMATMIILLPLHYIDYKKKAFGESLFELREAVRKLIGDPS